jgi:prolyl oligopeptidase
MHMRYATLAAAVAAAFIGFGTTAAIAGTPAAQACAASGAPLVYPVAKKVDQTDDYHGTKVADPYRWLEDANSAETKPPGSTPRTR